MLEIFYGECLAIFISFQILVKLFRRLCQEIKGNHTLLLSFFLTAGLLREVVNFRHLKVRMMFFLLAWIQIQLNLRVFQIKRWEWQESNVSERVVVHETQRHLGGELQLHSFQRDHGEPAIAFFLLVWNLFS